MPTSSLLIITRLYIANCESMERTHFDASATHTPVNQTSPGVVAFPCIY